MEELLIAAIINDRKAWETAQHVGIDGRDVGDVARFFLECAGIQYSRDSTLKAVDHNVLKSQIDRKFGEDSTEARLARDYLGRLPTETSGVVIVDEYRAIRLRKVSSTLAALLASGQKGAEVDELIERYRLLSSGEDEDAVPRWRMDPDDFGDEAWDMPLAPNALSNWLGGGVRYGHNIVVYGRPESGKSMFALNQAAQCCRGGFKVLYIANEEPEGDITKRVLARIARVNVSHLSSRERIRGAIEAHGEAYENWHLYHEGDVTTDKIARQAAKLNPDLIVVDQIKNVSAREDNRALQLDRIARDVRAIGIDNRAVTMSVTQAGDSAHGRLVLEMNHIEWSNTGIPGAADLMIGIGVDEEYDKQNKRMLSIPKNKVNGRHGAFPVWVSPPATAFLSTRTNGV